MGDASFNFKDLESMPRSIDLSIVSECFDNIDSIVMYGYVVNYEAVQNGV